MTENKSKFWLLTFHHFKNDIQTAEDNLTVLVHWLLLSNGFQVLGPGNENEISENEQPSDILPPNWSQDKTCKFRYTQDKKLFILNGVKAGDSFIFNLYNVSTKHVSSAALDDVTNIVKWISDVSNNEDDFQKIVNLLQQDLINPMKTENDDKKVASTQTQAKQPETTSSECSLLISRAESSRYTPYFPRTTFPSYGMPDLDPLGGLRNPAGGMIFNPQGTGRSNILPGVPPMARFDPINPSNPDFMMPGSRRPNPDHMRPPTFDDDMYM